MKALQLFVVALILLAAGWFGHQYFGESVTQLFTQAPEEEQITESEEESGMVCIQVITPARNPDTGEIKEFPTPCDVPEGWEKIENDVPGLDLEVQ